MRVASSRLVPWVAASFLVGTLLHSTVPTELTPLWIYGALAVFAGLFFWKWHYACCVIAMAIGLLRFDATLPMVEPAISLSGRIVSERRYDVLFQDEVSGERFALSDRRWRVGDAVYLTCEEVVRVAVFTERALRDAREGVWFRCRNPSIQRRDAENGWRPSRVLSDWRRKLTRRIQYILPGDSGALLSGILYGERGLSGEASASFRQAGMTHLIAVSGSNITLVVALFVPVFLTLGYKRKVAICLSGVAIACFVIFVGAQASVLRAAIMGFFALFARVFGRKASVSRLLLLAASTIVFFDPWALGFDAGFALSFLATWGLLALTRPIQSVLICIPERFGLRETITTTIAATIATLPYSLWAFKGATLAGLLTNIIAIPLVPLAMAWGSLAILLATILPVLALPARGALEGMLAIASVANQFPWLLLSFTIPTWLLFFIYGSLAYIFARWDGVISIYPQKNEGEIKMSRFLRGVSKDFDKTERSSMPILSMQKQQEKKVVETV